MTDKKAYLGAEIFDGIGLSSSSALLINQTMCDGVVPINDIPAGYEVVKLDGGRLAPGFVDLQVNGGGGALFNETPTVDSIMVICRAHRQFGTTALLPTLITDTPDNTKRAIEAGIEAQALKIPGFLGLHLEGPHLSVEKKGAHRPDLIRRMTDNDLSVLCKAKNELHNLLVTVAPETVDPEQISQLVSAGIRVSLGHTAATAKDAKKAFAAGASSVTHLYNAMSPLTHREPGVVGAALTADLIFCGLIADGYHVDPDTINIALKMKAGVGKLFLVTDAMSTIGTNQQEFMLNGRVIKRNKGRLTLSDGTLAGADLDMISAVRYMAAHTQCDWQQAFRMAAYYPSKYLGVSQTHGLLSKGSNANFIHVDYNLHLQSVWQMGDRTH